MRCQSSFAFIPLMILPLATFAEAHDASRYPNLKGQWTVIITKGLEGQAVKFDPTKPWGRGQQAPLTAEYQKVHEDSMADQAKGGLGNYPTATCHPGGMPRMMSVGEYGAGNHLYPHRWRGPLPSYLHRWTPLADRYPADLRRLLDRKMDRRGRQRPLQFAGSRNAGPIQGAARLRRNRATPAFRQSVDLQRALLSRQDGPEHSS